MSARACKIFFFFNDTATTEIYTLSLHDALPICLGADVELVDPLLGVLGDRIQAERRARGELLGGVEVEDQVLDRKSTRLNSSHANISYAVFCLKKKKKSAPSTLSLEHTHALHYL